MCYSRLAGSVYLATMRRKESLGNYVPFRMSDELLHAVDEWRRMEPDIPVRSEAIRRLVEFALMIKAREKKPPS